ncbi:hypothetical protein ACHHV8_35850 [Paenibacillus sp. TAB 01]
MSFHSDNLDPFQGLYVKTATRFHASLRGTQRLNQLWDQFMIT